MKWYGRFTSIALALVLVAGVGCTGDTTGVDAPVVPEIQAEPSVETSMFLGDLLGGVGGLLGGVLELVGGVVGGLPEITGQLDC
jgi:hypothetical protein